jgi:plastocyanin
MDSRLLVAIGAALGALLLGIMIFSRSQPATQPQNWVVIAGADAEEGALQSLSFLPEKITIHAGDSVTWEVQSTDEHTVYFGAGGPPPALEIKGEDGRTYFNPVVFFASPDKTYDGTSAVSGGSLTVGGGQSNYTLTFPKPGVYEYICAFHPGMVGAIAVVPANQKLPKTQANYDKMARAEAEKSLGRAHELHQHMQQPEVVSRPDGSKEYTLELLGEMSTLATVLTFAPSPLHLKVGDTVTWKMSDPTELHTVTFPENSEELPEFALVDPQENGPPKLVVNSQVSMPGGEKTHTGSGYYNSGYLFQPEGQPGSTYSLTFTKPGTYEYFCLVHTTAKMKGTIIVEASARSGSATMQHTEAQTSTTATPAQGFALHIDAKKHINNLPEFVVHHYCKQVNERVIQCLLFDNDGPNAHLIGEETIISPELYASLPAAEQASWHHHKEEIPLVDAKLPGLSEEEIQKIVAAIEDTYGKVIIFWNPGAPAPVGSPSITKPQNH